MEVSEFMIRLDAYRIYQLLSQFETAVHSNLLEKQLELRIQFEDVYFQDFEAAYDDISLVLFN